MRCVRRKKVGMTNNDAFAPDFTVSEDDLRHENAALPALIDEKDAYSDYVKRRHRKRNIAIFIASVSVAAAVALGTVALTTSFTSQGNVGALQDAQSKSLRQRRRRAPSRRAKTNSKHSSTSMPMR